MTPGETRKQITDLTVKLVELGLCDEQNFPAIQIRDGEAAITVPGSPNFSIALRNVQYKKIYEELDRSRSFNMRMLDGGLIQLLYTFKNDHLDSHHLAYFPSPDLEAFQNDPDLYLEEQIYADILAKNIVPFPIRFDFDLADRKHIDVIHPKSHLTLGQYRNCRIPVVSPLSPVAFIRFLLRNFYNTAYKLYEQQIGVEMTHFADSITVNEQKIPHLRLRA